MKLVSHQIKTMIIENEEDVLQAMEYTSSSTNQLGYSNKIQTLLCLVTEESLVNALEHGAKASIEVFWNISYNEFLLEVKQSGPLFAIERRDELNVSSSGRGIQLILNIMDEVWLNQEDDNSFKLNMKKYNLRIDPIRSGEVY